MLIIWCLSSSDCSKSELRLPGVPSLGKTMAPFGLIDQLCSTIILVHTSNQKSTFDVSLSCLFFVISTKLLCLSKSEDLGSCFFLDLGSKHTYWCVLRREFSGMIQQSSHSFHVIIPATPFPTHPATLRETHHPPETHTVDEHVGLVGNCWETAGKRVGQTQRNISKSSTAESKSYHGLVMWNQRFRLPGL
jgi:hypothetical protein